MNRLLLLCLVLGLRVQFATGQEGIAQPAPIPVQATVSTVGERPVWVNIPTKIYHYAGSRWYGRTHRGKYLSEVDALAEGDRAARNEHHPVAPPTATPAPSPAAIIPPTPPAVTILIATPTPAATASPAATEALSTCIIAIAAQGDPAKLATLGERGANPRLKRILYWLAMARAAGADPGDVINQAQRQNGSAGTRRAPLVKASLLRNLRICDGLGLLTPWNLAGLRRGSAPMVTRGPYAGQTAEVDHIVPLARANGIGNELANLEMLPASLNRAKGAKVGERQLDLARKFHEAGLLSEAEFAEVQARFRPAGTEKYELQEQ